MCLDKLSMDGPWASVTSEKSNDVHSFPTPKSWNINRTLSFAKAGLAPTHSLTFAAYKKAMVQSNRVGYYREV
jgi:hypothetical protein